MKRTLFFMLLSAWLFAPATWAEDFVVDGIYYNILSSDDKTVEVTTGNYSGDVTIPATVTYEGSEYRVTSIGKDAFYECDGLTSVTIGKNVQTIGYRAFYGCNRLTSVTIGKNVQIIGNDAFYHCNGLTSVTIPESVQTIGIEAFYDCYKLTSVTIPEGVQTIGRDAFYGCSGLTSVTIPNSVTTIDLSAFSQCTNLTSVTIGKGVTTIGVYAFCRCNSLTSITIGEGVQTIGGYAFEGCSGLTSVTIPESVQTIGERAFYDCSGLTSVTAYNPIPVDIVVTYVWGSPLAFDGVDCANCKLYVPKGSVEAYRNAEGWSEFGEILPIDESSAITETRQEQADGHITVYNLQGVLVLESDDAADLKTLQNGAYIVNGKKMIIAR